jgi:outer membrane protein assembly factor BamB
MGSLRFPATGWPHAEILAFIAGTMTPVRFLPTVLLTLTIGCKPGGGAVPDGEIAMFRGGPAHVGVADGEAGTAYGGLLWKVRVGAPVRSSPVVADGVVYIGASDGKLRAIDARTGEVRWAAEVGAPIDAAPAVAGVLVLAATRGGEFLAFDRDDGAVRWRVHAGAELPLAWEGMSGDLYTASPAVARDVAIFGGGDGTVTEIELAAGNVRWRFATGGRVRGSPAVADGVVYAGSADGSLYAIALEDGRELWRFDTEGRRLDSSRYGYDRRTITSSPAVANGAVYFGSRDGSLYAVDAVTGRLRWRVLHDDTSWSIASPAVVDGLVLDASSDAWFFHAVNAATGRVVWRVDTEAPIWPSPVVAGGTAWFLTSTGELWGVEPGTGAVRERVHLGERTKSSPWIEDGVLYVGTDEGSVLAVRLVDPPGLGRAVYWDESTEGLNGVAASEIVRDFFAARGYRVLGADSLAAFLAARAADRAPSVVVFAQDQLPEGVGALPPEMSVAAPLRRYLDAGGKAVWLGLPPLIWPAGPDGRAYSTIDRPATRRLLEVDHTPAFFDAYGATVTAAGRRWGLEGGWTSRWAADTAGVEVLALDENGHAAAWVKSYRGAPGSGFIRLEADGRDPARLALVAAIAERFAEER